MLLLKVSFKIYINKKGEITSALFAPNLPLTLPTIAMVYQMYSDKEVVLNILDEVYKKSIKCAFY